MSEFFLFRELFTEEGINSFLPEKDGGKKSPGIDALVVDQATLCHMIFPALPTVCEDAIHSERIGSPLLHRKSRDAPINTQDVQTFLIAPFRGALPVTSRLHALFATFGLVNKGKKNCHVLL